MERGWHGVLFWKQQEISSLLQLKESAPSWKLTLSLGDWRAMGNKSCFQVLKQDCNFQTHPDIIFMCRTLLGLVEASAEVSKSYKVCRGLPSLPLLISSGFVSKTKGLYLGRWGQEYMEKFQMLWFSVNIPILTGQFVYSMRGAAECNAWCLLGDLLSIYRARKAVHLNQEPGIAWNNNYLSKTVLRQGKSTLQSTLWPFTEMISSQLLGCHEAQTLQWGLMAPDLKGKGPSDIHTHKKPNSKSWRIVKGNITTLHTSGAEKIQHNVQFLHTTMLGEEEQQLGEGGTTTERSQK